MTALVFVVLVLLWPSEVPPQDSPLPEAPEIDLVGTPSEFDSTRSSFSIAFHGVRSDLRLMSMFVMPGEEVHVSIGERNRQITLAADSGTVVQSDSGRWSWTAPVAPGLYELTFREEKTRETIILRAFVKVPFHADSLSVNGYQIGQYAREPYRGNSFYTFPTGFVEVQPDLLEQRISPHFTIGQFVAKQVSPYPKYLLLQEKLILKLEELLRLVNQSIRPTPTFHVMSGFRTPHYNRLIGNTTTYSVHLYGGAADIFVDNDGDTYMDDLNGDGSADVEDARILADLVEDQVDEPWYHGYVGGLGIYSPAPHRGPFIHVDVRGERARW